MLAQCPSAHQTSICPLSPTHLLSTKCSSIHLPTPPLCPSIHRSIHRSIRPSVYLSVLWSVCLPCSLAIQTSMYPPICIRNCMPIFLAEIQQNRMNISASLEMMKNGLYRGHIIIFCIFAKLIFLVQPDILNGQQKLQKLSRWQQIQLSLQSQQFEEYCWNQELTWTYTMNVVTDQAETASVIVALFVLH